MKSRIAVLVVIGALSFSPVARAQDARAEALFQAAQGLMEQGKFAEACPKFAESHRIEPGIGVLLYWADCLEKNGQLASAWAKFEDGAKSARAVGQTDREAQARQRVDALAPRLSRITIAPSKEAAAVAGLTVRRDGIEIASTMFDTPVPVDAGKHVIEATAPGREPFRTEIEVRSAQTAAVAIPVLAQVGGTVSAPAPDAAPGAPPTEETSTWSGQKTAALVVGGVGVVGLTVGSIFGIQTFSSWAEAEDDCDRVPGETALQCGDAGTDAGDAATTQGAIATVGFAVGGAALVGAAILWLTAPDGGATDTAALRVLPAIDATGGGAALGGSF